MPKQQTATRVAQKELSLFLSENKEVTLSVLQFSQTLLQEHFLDNFFNSAQNIALNIANNAYSANKVLSRFIRYIDDFKDDPTIRKFFSPLDKFILEKAYAVSNLYYQNDHKALRDKEFSESYKLFEKENTRVFKQLINYVESLKS